MNKLQKCELEIAYQIKLICEAHNINYFIDYGTLLGAVRHGGFIPWDDDFDIGMMREDYDLFLKIAAKELPPNLFLQTFETDKYFGLPFTKVRMNNTTFLESSCKKCKAHSGIYVDIFPYDNFDKDDRSSNKVHFNLLFYSTLLKLKCKIKPWYYHGFNIWTYLKFSPFYLLSLFYSKAFLIERYKHYILYYATKNCKKVICSDSNMRTLRLFNKTNYEKLQLYKFENYEFSGPEAFDSILSCYYGDYMRIPDDINKKSTHDLLVVDYDRGSNYEN